MSRSHQASVNTSGKTAHSLAGIFHIALARLRMPLRFGFWPVDAFEREELEVVVLIEPGALEVLERKVSSTAQR